MFAGFVVSSNGEYDEFDDRMAMCDLMGKGYSRAMSSGLLYPRKRARHSLFKISEMESIPDSTMPRIIVNVSGHKFELLEQQIKRLPHSRLSKMVLERQQEPLQEAKTSYFFARNPKIFVAVANLYMTGELHLDENWCGSSVRSELMFWQIDEKLISPCCRHIIGRYTSTQRVQGAE